jgi:hypothetical protein
MGRMNLHTLIPLIALLDLAVVLMLFAVVRLTHRLHRYEQGPETLHPSQPIPSRLALDAEGTERLAKAA